MLTAALLVVCRMVAPTVVLPFSEAEFDAGVTIGFTMLIAADVFALG
jgi:hypothetical protein